MIAKKRLKCIGFSRLFLIPAIAFVLIMIVPGALQSRASWGMSTQTSCIDDQPCHTVICREDQPCKTLNTPNSEFDVDSQGSTSQPLEDEGMAQPLEGGTIEMVPIP
jgi:hypothetical protein